MKAVLAAVLLAACVFARAQNLPASLPSACGPKNSGFNVRLDKSRHEFVEPEPGKARVYFIQETSAVLGTNENVLYGIDGMWVGANRAFSYFSVSVEPGEHHFCAAAPFYRESKVAVLAHLDAEAGKTYFYRVRRFDFMDMSPIDSDEGKYLLSSYPLSVFQLNK